MNPAKYLSGERSRNSRGKEGSICFSEVITLLRLSVEYATKEVSRPSFTVKTPLLSRATKQVYIGNIMFY